MTYDDWRDATLAQVIAEELGYSHADEVPAQLMVDIQHKLSEIWIEYRMNNPIE